MADARPDAITAPGTAPALQPPGATAVMVFADGPRAVERRDASAPKDKRSASCASAPQVTGYQEVMTDPSYARQMIAFTFPHIGNVGANDEDVEAGEAHALGTRSFARYC